MIPINRIKKSIKVMNNSKNKLNNKLNWLFKLENDTLKYQLILRTLRP